MFDIICLTGHRKSGTTMFHKLFDGHPGLNVYPVDISILYAYFPCFADKNKMTDKELQQRIELVLRSTMNKAKEYSGASENLPDIDIFIECFWRFMTTRDILSRADIILSIAESWQDSLGLEKDKPFLFKETSQAIHFQEISQNMPSCKFINLIRDPRDNYAAIKSGVDKYYSAMGENEFESLASVINRARMDMLAATLYSNVDPYRFYSLRFEDLTATPDNEIKKVADFIGIEFDPCLLEPTVFGRKYSGNSHEGKKFIGISSENVGKWKERISDFEAQVIEFWLGDVMKIWGYKRIFTQLECVQSFAEFYNWYNCNFFFYDSFAHK